MAPDFKLTPFRDTGEQSHAIAAVSPDGGSKWMAAEELEPLFGGSSIPAKAEG